VIKILNKFEKFSSRDTEILSHILKSINLCFVAEVEFLLLLV